ncbi:hypothetical protein MFM001_45910 [Mycobacterium sp. MFM001]|nr:hypothetical protein MFM001_45910 [Mycobacterium sp. MFM001]
MGDRHPLRHSGGARGVNQIRDVVGVGRGQCGVGLVPHSGIVDIDDRQLASVEPFGQFGRGDHRYRGGIGKQELEARRRRRYIDR